MIRGIRGAACVRIDTREQVLQTALELFEIILDANHLEVDSVSAVFITVTPDIRSAFPAEGIRTKDAYRYIPIMCAQEIPVDGSLEKCLRMLVMADCPGKSQSEVCHPYLGRARELRKDLEMTS